jgi:peptide/nickel transport system substrate-binding protein
VCSTALYGNAASRLSEVIPSDGAWAYGGYPDIDALFKQQAVETDRKKREGMRHEIQQLVYERARYEPIFEYIWPSGVGSRVAEPGLLLIDRYPWSAPLEEVRLKQN